MIDRVFEVVAKPGRTSDLCRAIRDNLAAWQSQPGFVDQIVLADADANHVVAQTFWRSEDDADRFDRDVFGRIVVSIQELAAGPLRFATYRVGASTNRNIVPDAGDAEASPASPSGATVQTGGVAAQTMKVPPALFISSLEWMLRLSRGAQSVYDDLIDRAVATEGGRSELPLAAPADMVRDTLRGLVAFVVPGPDSYSVAQGMSTAEAGGLDASILEILIGALNQSQPSPAGGPPPAAAIAAALNQIAQQVNGAAQGPFASPFARLTFADKARVFQAIEANPETWPLTSLLQLTAFLVYSEAGVFDPRSRTIRARPLGWRLSSYTGVADGRDEFKGYWQNRRSVETSDRWRQHGLRAGV
ncbi:MAG TPA: hypothetical protein VGF59_20635 [Bryobacteraceae bacterium]